jgi:hypothetical protein
MTHVLTFQPYANTAENDVGFISITENTGSPWWTMSTLPDGHDHESVKRILTAKRAAPVAVLQSTELLSWLNK